MANTPPPGPNTPPPGPNQPNIVPVSFWQRLTRGRVQTLLTPTEINTVKQTLSPLAADYDLQITDIQENTTAKTINYDRTTHTLTVPNFSEDPQKLQNQTREALRQAKNQEINEIHTKAQNTLTHLIEKYKRIKFEPSKIAPYEIPKGMTLNRPQLSALQSRSADLTKMQVAIGLVTERRREILSGRGWRQDYLFEFRWDSQNTTPLNTQKQNILEESININKPIQISLPANFPQHDLTTLIQQCVSDQDLKPNRGQALGPSSNTRLHSQLNDRYLDNPVVVAKIAKYLDAIRSALNPWPQDFHLILCDNLTNPNQVNTKSEYHHIAQIDVRLICSKSLTDILSAVQQTVAQVSATEQTIETNRAMVETEVNNLSGIAGLYNIQFTTIAIAKSSLDEEMRAVDPKAFPNNQNSPSRQPVPLVNMTKTGNSIIFALNYTELHNHPNSVQNEALRLARDEIATEMQKEEADAEQALDNIQQNFVGEGKGITEVDPNTIPPLSDNFRTAGGGTDLPRLQNHQLNLIALLSINQIFSNLSDYQKMILCGDTDYQRQNPVQSAVFTKLIWYPDAQGRQNPNGLIIPPNRAQAYPLNPDGILFLEPLGDLLAFNSQEAEQILINLLPDQEPPLSATITPEYQHPFMMERLFQLERVPACGQFLVESIFDETVTSNNPIDRLDNSDPNHPKMILKSSDFVGKTKQESENLLLSLRKEIDSYTEMETARSELSSQHNITLPDDAAICRTIRRLGLSNRRVFELYFQGILLIADNNSLTPPPTEIAFEPSVTCQFRAVNSPARLVLPADPSYFNENLLITELTTPPDRDPRFDTITQLWRALELDGVIECPIVIARISDPSLNSIETSDEMVACILTEDQDSMAQANYVLLLNIVKALEKAFAPTTIEHGDLKSSALLESYAITLSRFLRAATVSGLALPSAHIDSLEILFDTDAVLEYDNPTKALAIPAQMTTSNLALTLKLFSNANGANNLTPPVRQPLTLNFTPGVTPLSTTKYTPSPKPDFKGNRLSIILDEVREKTPIKHPSIIYALTFEKIRNEARRYLTEGCEDPKKTIAALNDEHVRTLILNACLNVANKDEAGLQILLNQAASATQSHAHADTATNGHDASVDLNALNSASLILALTATFNIFPVNNNEIMAACQEFKPSANEIKKIIKEIAHMEERHDSMPDQLKDDQAVMSLREDIIKLTGQRDSLSAQSRELRYLEGLLESIITSTQKNGLALINERIMEKCQAELSKTESLSLRLIIRAYAAHNGLLAELCDPPDNTTTPSRPPYFDELEKIKKNPNLATNVEFHRIAQASTPATTREVVRLNFLSYLVRPKKDATDRLKKEDYSDKWWYPIVQASHATRPVRQDISVFIQQVSAILNQSAQNRAIPQQDEIMQAIVQITTPVENKTDEKRTNTEHKPSFEELLIQTLHELSYLEHSSSTSRMAYPARVAKVKQQFREAWIVIREEDNYGDAQFRDALETELNQATSLKKVMEQKRHLEKSSHMDSQEFNDEVKALFTKKHNHEHLTPTQEKEKAQQERRKMQNMIKKLQKSDLAGSKIQAELFELFTRVKVKAAEGKETEELRTIFQVLHSTKDGDPTMLHVKNGPGIIKTLLDKELIGVGQVKEMLDKIEQAIAILVPSEQIEAIAWVRDLETYLYDHLNGVVKVSDAKYLTAYPSQFVEAYSKCETESKLVAELQEDIHKSHQKGLKGVLAGVLGEESAIDIAGHAFSEGLDQYQNGRRIPAIVAELAPTVLPEILGATLVELGLGYLAGSDKKWIRRGAELARGFMHVVQHKGKENPPKETPAKKAEQK